MNHLFEQLEANYEREEQLNERYKHTLTSAYWHKIATSDERINELILITNIKKRVYRLRYRLLENIHAETTKQMYIVSAKQRNLNFELNNCFINNL